MNNRLFTFIEIVVIAGLIMAVLYWGGVFKFGPEPTPTPTRPLNPTSPPRPTHTPSSLTPVPTHPPLVAASGLIAFESTRDGNSEIYVMNSDGSDQRNLTQNTADDSLPIWSPDGSRLAFFSTRSGYFEIYILNLADLSTFQVTNSSGTNTAFSPVLAWSPDGQYLLAARTDPWAVRGYHHPASLDQIRTDNFQVTTLAEFEQAMIINLSWSPDSRHIAVHISTPNSYGIQIGDISVAPFELTTTDNCFAGAWAKDGKFSCYSDTNLYSLDVTSWIKDFIMAAPGIEDIAWSPDGKYLLSIDYAYNSDDQVFRVILPENSGLSDPLFERANIIANYTNQGEVPFSGSSDGQWLTYDSTENNRSNIYIVNIFETENPIQLTQDEGNNYAPQWQPQP